MGRSKAVILCVLMTTAVILSIPESYVSGGLLPIADAGMDQVAFEGETVYFNGTGSYDPDYDWHRLNVNFATDSALILRQTDPIGPYGGAWEGGVREWVTFNSSKPFWIGKHAGHLGQGATGQEYTYYWKMHATGIFNLGFRAANGEYYADVNDMNGTSIVTAQYATSSDLFTYVPRQLYKEHVYRLDIYDTVCTSGFPNDLDVLFQILETDILVTPEVDSMVYYVTQFPLDLAIEGPGVTNITFYSRLFQGFFVYYASYLNHSEVEVSEGELSYAPPPYNTGITPGEYNDTTMNIADELDYSWDFDANVDTDFDGNSTNDKNAIGPMPMHVYGDDGDYNVTLNVTAHSNGLSGTDTVLVTVANLPPTIVPFGPFSTNAGFPLNLDATATDPGSDDLNFTWDWGDGTLDTISVHYNDGFGPDPYPSPLGTYPYSALDAVQHTYMYYGIYTLNLTVEDDDGGVALYSTTVTVGAGLERPFLYIDPDPNGDDVVLHWITPSTPDLDHYLIYRSTSQTAFDFDTIWMNTSTDINPVTGVLDLLYTMWIDRNVTNSGHPEYRDEYYYTIRSVNIAGNKSTTSNTAGYYIMQFYEGLNTFSLPLEPFTHPTLDEIMGQMGAATISWLDDNDEWLTYPSDPSPPQAEMGEGYVVEFIDPSPYVFTGEPVSMIIYKEGFGFDEATRDDINAEVDPSGNIDISWIPIAGVDKYYLYKSNIRHGFHTGTYDVIEVVAPPYQDLGAASSYGELYYLVIPHNSTLGNGSSTYSIGVITFEYNDNEMIGLPLKPIWGAMSADWYVDQIPYCLGLVYLQEGIWLPHFKEFDEGVYDTTIEYGRGYEISVYTTGRFSFVGW